MTILKIIACVGILVCNNGSKKVSVSISTTQTSSYCGGVEPDDNLLVELRTPKPWTADLFAYTTTGKHQIIKISKDKSIDLVPGVYLLSPRDNLSPNDVSTVINKKETTPGSSNPYVNAKIITISKDSTKQHFDYNFHYYCAHELDPNVPPPPSMERRDR